MVREDLELAQPREKTPQPPFLGPAISTHEGLLRSLATENHVLFEETAAKSSALMELRNLACAGHSDMLSRRKRGILWAKSRFESQP